MSKWLSLLGLVFFGGAITGVYMWVSPQQRHRHAMKVVSQTSVAGLAKGAPVLYMGFPVGEVTQLTLEYDSIHINTELYEAFPLNTSSYAIVEYVDMTGRRQISVYTPNRNAAAHSQDIPVLKARESISDRLPGEALNVLYKLENLVANLNDLLEDNRLRLDLLFKEVAQASRQIRLLSQDVRIIAEGIRRGWFGWLIGVKNQRRAKHKS